MMVAALALALYGLSGTLSSTMNALLGVGAPIIGGFFTALTLVILIADLKRPDRALFLVTRPNPTSWLVWGGYILSIFGLIEVAWFIPGLVGSVHVLAGLLIPPPPFWAAGARSTAFLFWHSHRRHF